MARDIEALTNLIERRKILWQLYPIGLSSHRARLALTSRLYSISHGASISTDGIFGSGTRSAVVSFQSKKGLVVDGVAR